MLAFIENIELTDKVHWIEVGPLRDCVLRILAVTKSDGKVKENQAIIMFHFTEVLTQNELNQSGLTRESAVGPYYYLNTCPGVICTDLQVVVPPSAILTEIGVRTWYAGGAIALKCLSIDQTPLDFKDIDISISIDVEALPGRAHADHLKKLIVGEWEGGKYGISRLCDIFADYGVTASFMLDYAECDLYGDREIFNIGNELAGRGHDVQLHLHSEVITRNQKWSFPGKIFPGFLNLNYSEARRVIEYGCEKYQKHWSRKPRVFRTGGYQFNRDALLATSALGIEATSNFRLTNDVMKRGPVDYAMTGDIFTWENGLYELPVDFSPEPLSNVSLDRFLFTFNRAMAKKRFFNNFNLVIHSWSLLTRDAEGYVSGPDPLLETNLRTILEFLAGRGRFVPYSQLLEKVKGTPFPACRLPEPIVEKINATAAGVPELFPYPESKRCNICNTSFHSSAVATTDVCGFCKSKARHRMVKWLFDLIGNPINGKEAIVCHATPTEVKAFFAKAARLANFDIRPLEYLDFTMDIQDMRKIGDGEFDCFMALHVLNHVKDDLAAIRGIHRVLKPGGLFIATVPYRAGQPTTPVKDLTQHYGQEALEKYGVGSYRYYGIEDFVALLSPLFEVSRMGGYDPISGIAESVFLCKKK